MLNNKFNFLKMMQNRVLHGNCGATLRACSQTLPQGNFHFIQSFAFCLTAHHGTLLLEKCTNRDDSNGKRKGLHFLGKHY